MSELSKRLKEERKKAGLTQEEVADYLGITRPAYTQYETDKTQPSLETAGKLADLYKISVDYLMGRLTVKETLIASFKSGLKAGDKLGEEIIQKKANKKGSTEKSVKPMD